MDTFYQKKNYMDTYSINPQVSHTPANALFSSVNYIRSHLITRLPIPLHKYIYTLGSMVLVLINCQKLAIKIWCREDIQEGLWTAHIHTVRKKIYNYLS